jgi:hypothetical protein
MIAFVLQCAQKLGEGVADNAQFELVVASAVGLGLAFDRIDIQRVDRSRLTIVVILIVGLLASSNTVPYRAVASPSFRAIVEEHAAVVEQRPRASRLFPVRLPVRSQRYAAWPGNHIVRRIQHQ